jgi:putative NADH-flavin reductase
VNLTIIAATGGIGRHLLAQALDQGHTVTAVVRNPAKLERRPSRRITADLTRPDPRQLAVAVEDADAVLSAYGAHGRGDAGITASGTRAVIEAMQSAGVRRLVAVSAAPVLTIPSPGRPNPPRHDPADSLLMRYVLGPLFRRSMSVHLHDLAAMEDDLRASGLEWTVVRPADLDDAPRGRYRTAVDANPPSSGLVPKVGRADVADFMLRSLSDPTTVKQAIGIVR